MIDLPYTDADLRAEAARQHAALTEDPDYMGVGEMMEDSPIESTTALVDQPVGPTWGEALPYNHDDGNAFNAAQRKIHDLICKAADVSDWAINLSADGLEPLAEQITAHMDDAPWFRLHFAVRPDMPDDMRRALVEGVGAEIAKHF